jgi:hypothetical protein
VIRFLAAVLALVPALLLADIPVAEPGVIPADTTDYSRFNPLVVAGDDGFLVVWEEGLFAGIYPAASKVRAYDLEGRPRRPVASLLSFDAHHPRVAWTGSEYLLIAATTFSRFGSSVPLPAVVAIRIRADGTEVAGSQVVLAEARSQASVVSLAWNGSEALAYFFVEAQPRLLRLNAQGRVLSDESNGVGLRPISIVAAPGAPQYVLFPHVGDVAAVAPGAVAIIDDTSIGPVVTLLDEQGQTAHAFLIAPPATRIRSLAWDGRAWVAVYATADSLCTLRFTRESDLVRTCEPETSPRSPSIAAAHGRTFRAWARGDDQIVTDGGIASMRFAPQVSPSATVDAEGIVVAWIEAGRVRVGRPGGEARFIDGAQNATLVRIDGSLVVWVADGAVWMSIAGTPLRLGDGSDVVLASNANGWLVAWKQGAEIVSTFVTRNGDPAGLEHYGAEGVTEVTPRIEATPHGFLLLWAEEEQTGGRWQTRAVVEALGAGGARTSGGVRLYELDGNYALALSVALGCGATHCLATWGPVDKLPIGFDGRPLGEPKRVLDFGAPKLIVPRHDGTFDIYQNAFITTVRADGTTVGMRRWTTESPNLAEVVAFGNTHFAVFSRFVEGAPRVFVRDLAMRGRAARH